MSQNKIIKAKITNYADPENPLYGITTRKITVYREGKFYIPNRKNEQKQSIASDEQLEKWREERQKKYLYEVKNRIIQYAWCNDFDQFWTLTFAEDRYDIDLCYKKMRAFLRRVMRKYGCFRYIIVPEFHKDNAVHFHALVGGYKGTMAESGVLQKGNMVYNIDDWEYGFTNAQFIHDRKAIGAYISKYIVKSFENSPAAKGKKKYWHSRGLKSAQTEYIEHEIEDYLKTKYEPVWVSDDETKAIYEIDEWQEFYDFGDDVEGRLPHLGTNLIDYLRGEPPIKS